MGLRERIRRLERKVKNPIDVKIVFEDEGYYFLSEEDYINGRKITPGEFERWREELTEDTILVIVKIIDESNT